MAQLHLQPDRGPFLSLPREIRDAIYHYAIDWPNLSTITPASTSHDQLLEPHEEGHRSRKTTPGILLANQQISREVLHLLRSKPLVFDPISLLSVWESKCLDYRVYICEATLQNLRCATLRLNLQYREDQRGFSVRLLICTRTLLDLWIRHNKLEKLIFEVQYSPIDDSVPLDIEKRMHRVAVRRLTQKNHFYGTRKFHARATFPCHASTHPESIQRTLSGATFMKVWRQRWVQGGKMLSA